MTDSDEQLSIAELSDKFKSEVETEEKDFCKIDLNVLGEGDKITEVGILDLFSTYPDILSVIKKNKTNLKLLSKKSKEWFEKRLAIIPSYSGDVHYLFWKLFVLDQPLFITDEFFDFITDEKWPSLLRDYTLTFLSNSNEINLEDLGERMRFMQSHISEIALESDIFSRSESLKELILSYFDFLKFYHDTALEDEWRVVMGNGDKRKYLKDLVSNIIHPLHEDPEQDYDSWADRDELPIDVDDSLFEHEDALRDLVDKIGFRDLAKGLVSKVIFSKNKHKNSFSNYSGKIYIFNTEALAVKSLFHELGHAFHKYLRQHKEYHHLLYKYVLQLTVYNALYFFSDSYTLTEGKNTYQHIAESFAEDLRWFFFLPEAVPKNRFRIVGKMVEAVFPTINIEQAREKIRSTLSDLYNIDVDSTEMVMGVVCDVQKFLDRPTAPPEI